MLLFPPLRELLKPPTANDLRGKDDPKQSRYGEPFWDWTDPREPAPEPRSQQILEAVVALSVGAVIIQRAFLRGTLDQSVLKRPSILQRRVLSTMGAGLLHLGVFRATQGILMYDTGSRIRVHFGRGGKEEMGSAAADRSEEAGGVMGEIKSVTW